jgi:hypothetical protein
MRSGDISLARDLHDVISLQDTEAAAGWIGSAAASPPRR